MPLLFSTPLQQHIYTQSEAFHNHRVTYSSETQSCLQPYSFVLCLQEEMSSSVREGEGRAGKGGGRGERERKRGELVSERNKIARERKETETPAICECGSEPNHCPQSPGTCLTASFCNGSPALLPQTTGLWNHTQKHSSHQGQTHPYGHK